MQHRLWPLVLGFTLAAACGGDDDPAKGTTGTTGGKGGSGGTSATGGTGGDAGATGEAGSMGDAGTGGTGSPNVMCDPKGSGVCQNATDCPAVESGDARRESGICGIQCLEDEDPGTCAVACIVDAADISAACAACYAGAVACGSENCLNECIENPEAESCIECQVEAGCRSEFSECSGLPE